MIVEMFSVAINNVSYCIGVERMPEKKEKRQQLSNNK